MFTAARPELGHICAANVLPCLSAPLAWVTDENMSAEVEKNMAMLQRGLVSMIAQA